MNMDPKAVTHLPKDLAARWLAYHNEGPQSAEELGRKGNDLVARLKELEEQRKDAPDRVARDAVKREIAEAKTELEDVTFTLRTFPARRQLELQKLDDDTTLAALTAHADWIRRITALVPISMTTEGARIPREVQKLAEEMRPWGGRLSDWAVQLINIADHDLNFVTWLNFVIGNPLFWPKWARTP